MVMVSSDLVAAERNLGNAVEVGIEKGDLSARGIERCAERARGANVQLAAFARRGDEGGRTRGRDELERRCGIERR